MPLARSQPMSLGWLILSSSFRNNCNTLEALVVLFAAHSKLRKWLFVTNNPSSTKLRRIDRLYSSHDTAIFPTLRSQIKRIYILDSCLGGCKVGGTDV